MLKLFSFKVQKKTVNNNARTPANTGDTPTVRNQS